MMQITIGAVQAFTERVVHGTTANRAKAEGWLAQNPIVVTALNPLIGYSQGAELVKEAASRNMTIHDIAIEKANDGKLKNVNGDRLVTSEEIEDALGDLRRLT
jgi:fumarate hydratase class II